MPCYWNQGVIHTFAAFFLAYDTLGVGGSSLSTLLFGWSCQQEASVRMQIVLALVAQAS